MKRCAAALAAILALFATTTQAGKTADQPTLAVTTLDGAHFDLAAQRGHWVVVNLWATWCTPCIEEMPAIAAFVQAHPGVAAIGLAWEDTDKADVQKFAKAHPVNYPLAQVDVYDPPKDFEPPRGLPTTYLIGPDGRVAHKFTGPVTRVDLDKALAAAGGS